MIQAVRRLVQHTLWRLAACGIAGGYGLTALALLGALPSDVPRQGPSHREALVVGLACGVLTVTAHRCLRRRGGRWKPDRSLLQFLITTALVVMAIPVAIALWPITIFVLIPPRGRPLTERERALGLAHVTITRFGLK